MVNKMHPDLSELDLFLKNNSDLSVIKLYGFFTAIITGPELITESQWLEIANIKNINFKLGGALKKRFRFSSANL